MFLSFTNLNLVFTLHNDEFTRDELLLSGFLFFYNFRDGAPYAGDHDVPMNLPKIWGVSPCVPNVRFPTPTSRKLGETL